MSGDPVSLYEEVLAAADGQPTVSTRPPRASAAVALYRTDRGELEVFWLRRGRTLPFMGGWWAFPGGAIERADAERPLESLPRGLEPGRTTRAAPDADVAALPSDAVPGLVAGALRELAEETGTLLPPERLVFAGRWLTPPLGPIRFDNRFFLAEFRVAEDREPSALPPESEEGEWIAPGAALARWQRGELLAAPSVLHLLRVLAEDGPEGGLARLLDASEANLGPLRRIEFTPGLLAFPLASFTLPPATHLNVYLLGWERAVLVDPGSPHPAENARLLAALAAARERLGREVTAIWLTHHHPDHVAGVETVRAALGVPVLAHRSTAERLARRGLAVDGELAHGDRWDLGGDEAEVLHTPGHARGHLCFRLLTSGALLAGDLVAGFGTIVIDPPEGDLDQYLESLAAMERLAPRLLFPAHGPPLADGLAKLTEYREHRLERERQVLAAWRAGHRDPAALIAPVYGDLSPFARPLAERQLRAHLERLERRGEI